MQTYFLIMKIPKPAQNHLPSLTSTIMDNLSFLPFSLMLENFKANLSYYVTPSEIFQQCLFLTGKNKAFTYTRVQ